MTVTVKDARIKITRDEIRRLSGCRGIDMVFKPYDRSQSIYDLRLQATDMTSVPLERKYREDVEKQLENFNIIADRMRDSPLYVKSFDKQKCEFYFETNDANKALDSIDEVRKNAKVLQNNNGIGWSDIS